VKKKHYIPDCGDIVWLTFAPQAGHEQAGRRPAVVISPILYNEKTDLAIFCPITNQVKGYPFEVIIPPNLGVDGVILSDQIKNLDWKSRNAEFICKLPHSSFDEVMGKIRALLSL